MNGENPTNTPEEDRHELAEWAAWFVNDKGLVLKQFIKSPEEWQAFNAAFPDNEDQKGKPTNTPIDTLVFETDFPSGLIQDLQITFANSPDEIEITEAAVIPTEKLDNFTLTMTRNFRGGLWPLEEPGKDIVLQLLWNDTHGIRMGMNLANIPEGARETFRASLLARNERLGFKNQFSPDVTQKRRRSIPVQMQTYSTNKARLHTSQEMTTIFESHANGITLTHWHKNEQRAALVYIMRFPAR